MPGPGLAPNVAGKIPTRITVPHKRGDTRGALNEIGLHMTDRTQKQPWQQFHLAHARLHLSLPWGVLSGANIEANRRILAT